MTQATSPSTDRQILIRLIHVAKRELRMDDDTYRTLLEATGGADSTKGMGLPALRRVLDRMKASGFVVRPKLAGPGKRALADDAQSRKIRAIWLELHTLGIVRDASEAALALFCKRMTGMEALQWLNAKQASKLIEDLKAWRVRVESKEKTP